MVSLHGMRTGASSDPSGMPLLPKQPRRIRPPPPTRNTGAHADKTARPCASVATPLPCVKGTTSATKPTPWGHAGLNTEVLDRMSLWDLLEWACAGLWGRLKDSL